MTRRYTAVFLLSILKANISNEWYAKDTSKKIRAVMKSKGEAGEHLCTNPPYGYMKDPENKKRWIIDPEAAEVVKRIFALCLDGYGPSQIARILKEDKVITPTIHFQQIGRATRNAPPDNRLTIACVANHEEQFRKAMGAKQKAEAKKELAAKRRQLTQAERRIEELDRLFKRIYEDNVGGKLSDSRFQMLSDDYEQEQEELREKLLRLNEEITKQEEQAENIDRFMAKYGNILTWTS